ncbi:unnamed protein product [Brachionus calyciflorus]|uniref:Ferritin/DPS domain-containing protein n=1 Tax=Brachionus calyciflorus TaxID=104777 RepID=A0A814KBK2_9BILA|nr:unnamed protein product [Brachionus calyciflorus]
MSESKSVNLSKKCEDELNRFLNYLKYFSDKCNTLASVSHLHYENKFGLVDLFNWCSQDLSKMGDKVIDYLKQRGSQVHPEDLIASKFNIESEKKVNLHTLPAYDLVDYLHKEDTHYNDLLNDMIKCAERENDHDLKQFYESYKDELSNWNKKIDGVLDHLRSARMSAKLTDSDLDNLYKNKFKEITQFREI